MTLNPKYGNLKSMQKDKQKKIGILARNKKKNMKST